MNTRLTCVLILAALDPACGTSASKPSQDAPAGARPPNGGSGGAAEEPSSGDAGASAAMPEEGSNGVCPDQPAALKHNGLRIAQLSPDLPPLDVCIRQLGEQDATEPGNVDWSGVYPALRDAAWYAYEPFSPLRYPQVTVYLPIERPGSYAIRFVSKDSTDCSHPLDQAPDIVGLNFDAERAYTLMLAGLVGRGGEALRYRSTLLTDEAANDPNKLGVRFVHAALPFGAVDFGFELQASAGEPERLFQGVKFTNVAAADKAIDELGYAWMDAPLVHAKVTLWVADSPTWRVQDNFYNTNACLGDVRSVFSIGLDGSSSAPMKLLVCEDSSQSHSTSGTTISCVARPPLSNILQPGQTTDDVGVNPDDHPDTGPPLGTLRVWNFLAPAVDGSTLEVCARPRPDAQFAGPLLKQHGKASLAYGEQAVLTDIPYGLWEFELVDGNIGDCASAVPLTEVSRTLAVDATSPVHFVVAAGEPSSAAFSPRILDVVGPRGLATAVSEVRLLNVHSGVFGSVELFPTVEPGSLAFPGRPVASGATVAFTNDSWKRNAQDFDDNFPVDTALSDWPDFSVYTIATVGLRKKLGAQIAALPTTYLTPIGNYQMFVGRHPKRPTDATSAAVWVCKAGSLTCECFSGTGPC